MFPNIKRAFATAIIIPSALVGTLLTTDAFGQKANDNEKNKNDDKKKNKNINYATQGLHFDFGGGFFNGRKGNAVDGNAGIVIPFNKSNTGLYVGTDFSTKGDLLPKVALNQYFNLFNLFYLELRPGIGALLDKDDLTYIKDNGIKKIGDVVDEDKLVITGDIGAGVSLATITSWLKGQKTPKGRNNRLPAGRTTIGLSVGLTQGLNDDFKNIGQNLQNQVEEKFKTFTLDLKHRF